MLNIIKPMEVIRKYIGSIVPSIPIFLSYYMLIALTISLIVLLKD